MDDELHSGVCYTDTRTDVGMVYLGKEAHLGWRHWVLLREEQFELEDSICTGVIAQTDGSQEGPDVLWNGLPSGPWMVTSKYLRLSS